MIPRKFSEFGRNTCEFSTIIFAQTAVTDTAIANSAFIYTNVAGKAARIIGRFFRQPYCCPAFLMRTGGYFEGLFRALSDTFKADSEGLGNEFGGDMAQCALAHRLALNLQVFEGSGYFFHVKMPGYGLASLAAATTLQFTACCIQLPLSQNPIACIA
jgi:hypothetical protein